MPSEEQMLYAQWSIVEAILNSIKDQAEDTDFEHLEDLFDKFCHGAAIIRLQMKEALK